jgi:hypothetical protein
MSEPLDESYLVWLYRQVADSNAKDPSLTYWNLLRTLFKQEFVWVVPNDDNRLEDGKDLRLEFLRESHIDHADVDDDWIGLGCSVLELMVGLSRRLAFEADGEPYYWFWRLMENIGLQRYSDSHRLPIHHIEDVLERVIFRQYNYNGHGGFFPLKFAQEDQRNVELWYQLNAYVLELEE